MTPAPLPPGILLEARDLTLKRGDLVLVAGLDLTLSAGSLLLLRGPNGVGKSTLLLALAGIVNPDGGGIRHDDVPLHLLSHRTGLKSRLTVRENLDFWRRLNGGASLDPETVLARLGLAHLQHLEAGYLSAGQGKRLALARLLVSPRKLWLLDEPDAALDAEGASLLGQLLAAHCAQGGGAIVATHHDLPVTGAPLATLTLERPA